MCLIVYFYFCYLCWKFFQVIFWVWFWGFFPFCPVRIFCFKLWITCDSFIFTFYFNFYDLMLFLLFLFMLFLHFLTLWLRLGLLCFFLNFIMVLECIWCICSNAETMTIYVFKSFAYFVTLLNIFVLGVTMATEISY